MRNLFPCFQPTRNYHGLINNPFCRILVVSVGFMADAYDLFIFGIVIVIMGILNPNDNTTLSKSVLGISILIGTMIGQILFGTFGDKFGRKKIFFITLTIIMSFAFFSGIAFDIANTYFISLTMIRIVLGIGIGGEYPLSASIAAESSPSPKYRGCMMATVFSMQGVGNFLAPCVIILLLLANLPLEAVWRIGLSFGAIPGILTLYWRLKLEETHIPSTAKEKPVFNELRAHWSKLFGTSLTWLLFDIAFYGNGFFKETIVSLLHLNSSSDYERVYQTTLSSLIIAGIALPGYWCSLPLIEFVGRKPLQLIGFAAVAIIFFIMFFFQKQIEEIPSLFVILYGLTFFFSNIGPNTTTYVLSAEAFPIHIRSTAHGISAASGKFGALLGVAIFPSIVSNYGVPVVFMVCSVVSVIGFIITLIFIPETKGQALEETKEEYFEETKGVLEQ